MAFLFHSVSPPPAFSKEDWFNWKWQLRHLLKTQADYEKYFNISFEDKIYKELSSRFSAQSTPYYAKLAIDKTLLQKIIIPDDQELEQGRQALLDPLGEKEHSPVKHIIHRYPDRVVFLATDLCPIYCRYCTRKRFTAQKKSIINKSEYEKAIEYIAYNKGIREVILSGGDPLTLADSLIERILKDLRCISHVEIIRIGSRMPAVCPMRVTSSLISIIRKYQPIFMMTHFNHPDEITLEVSQTLTVLADSGIPVYNQMVLLKDFNNHPAIVSALSRRLLFLRARPYYMFQCDPSLGTDHLRTSVKNSRWIQKNLWGNLSGLAVPRLAVDLPGGGGKVEITPVSATDGNTFTGWDGRTAVYQDPLEEKTAKVPAPYLAEWQRLTQQEYGKKEN